MTPIYENNRSETPAYFHYVTGSKSMKFLCLVLNFWPWL